MHAIFKPQDLQEAGVSLWNSDWLNRPTRPSKPRNLKTKFFLDAVWQDSHRLCYLCDEAGIVALLFRPLQGGGPVVWKAQLLAFQERRMPSPWQCRFLPFTLTSFTTSCEEFKRQRQPGLWLRPSTPPCHPVRSSWLTFNSKACVKKGQGAWNACGRRGAHWPLPVSHLRLH